MKTKKRFLGILLSISLMLGLMPGMILTAYADGTTYNPASTYTDFATLNTNNTEVTISEVSGKTWYVIGSDTSTVTLLSKQSFDNKAFNSSGTGNDYATSEIKTYVDGLTGAEQPLAGIRSVISDLTLIDKATAQGLSETKLKGAGGANWWLCSPGNYGDGWAACVRSAYGDVDEDGRSVDAPLGVRPALKLNLSSVIFESETKTFSLKPAGYSVTLSGGANASIDGATSQTGLTGAMTTVTYTANTGYYFAEFADISSNGITATRTSSTVVTVSGTPTADAAITVPDAVEKTAATVTKAPTAKSLTYTGQAQGLVNAGEAENGTMQYALGTATEATQPYTTSIPTATDAGTYYVWYKASGDETHTDSDPKVIKVVITGKDDPEPTPTPDPEPTPTPDPDPDPKHKKRPAIIRKDNSGHEDNTPPANTNPLSLILVKTTGLPYGTIAARAEQGIAAKAVFAASTPAGWKEGFSFNLVTNNTNEMTLKNGTFTLLIPKDLQKAGRTFAILALDKSGKAYLLPDTDADPATITVSVNLEGYAFDLIYKD